MQTPPILDGIPGQVGRIARGGHAHVSWTDTKCRVTDGRNWRRRPVTIAETRHWVPAYSGDVTPSKPLLLSLTLLMENVVGSVQLEHETNRKPRNARSPSKDRGQAFREGHVVDGSGCGSWLQCFIGMPMAKSMGASFARSLIQAGRPSFQPCNGLN